MIDMKKIEIVIKYYIGDCFVKFSSYENGSKKIEILDENKRYLFTATEQIKGIKIPEDWVFIKNFDENQGILPCLLASKVLKQVESTLTLNGVKYYSCSIEQ
jgi:hypothetical protein